LNSNKIISIIDKLFTTKINITAEEGRREGKYEEMTRHDVCVTIQMEELANAIRQLSSTKAIGVDGVPGTIIKLLFEREAHNILSLINTIYKIDNIHVKWKITRVVLPAKSGKDPLLPTFYCPISILPAMSKLGENTFKSSIEKYLEQDP
jgi:hypothetical protein